MNINNLARKHNSSRKSKVLIQFGLLLTGLMIGLALSVIIGAAWFKWVDCLPVDWNCILDEGSSALGYCTRACTANESQMFSNLLYGCLVLVLLGPPVTLYIGQRHDQKS